MDVLLLGAGRPARGTRPSALKKLGLNTRAIDWQVRSIGALEGAHLHYLGGYHVEEVIRAYPELSFTVIADWEKHSVLHTLLQAPFSRGAALATYTDTVFRKETVEGLVRHTGDVIFGVDSRWEQRYRERAQDDLDVAETIDIGDFGAPAGSTVEFTGLVYFQPPVVQVLSTLDESLVGTTLVDLLHHLRDAGYSVQPHNVDGHWAEFNSPADIARFILGTKAETLERLEPFVQHSVIGKQFRFTTADWRRSPERQIAAIQDCFGHSHLVVRSSSKGEDGWQTSNAGGFESVLGVDGADDAAISRAVDVVIESYGSDGPWDDQVLVQRLVDDVRCAGVVFTCGLETGAPYYRFNFDDETQSTESVTAGTHDDLRTVVLSRSHPDAMGVVEPALEPVLRAVRELEELLGYDKLDIEFAVDQTGRVHVFQVRPITVDHSHFETENGEFSATLEESRRYFASQQAPGPFVVGGRTVFANMSDWNPAEIIGTRPRPLALSLYQELITNEVWATQRAEFGYRDVRPHPLIVTFSGQPYVDVRASLNSFIPAAVSDEVAEALVDAQVRLLVDHPHAHDKLEFDVAFTVWTPSFAAEAVERLVPYGVGRPAIDELGDALKAVTRDALSRLDQDIASIPTLRERVERITGSQLPPIDRAFALLDDCRRYGTLAFSHAARAGFVATSLLRSFVSTGILDDARRLEFMAGVDTVATDLQNDQAACSREDLPREALAQRYGHLRPGTYEITGLAYWENPAAYLSCDGARPAATWPPFALTGEEEEAVGRVLADLGAERIESPRQLFQYFAAAIQAREAVKFEFTRCLSRALDACVVAGAELGLSRSDLSFLEYSDLVQLRLSGSAAASLSRRIAQRRKRHVVTHLTQLPSLIVREEDFAAFEQPSSEPNFVTTGRVEARVVRLEDGDEPDLEGHVVLIPRADPGYDWLFCRGIAGLVTLYGGANSHMAIRAAEMELPAAIGVGVKLYERVARMGRLELDCANRVIREIP